MWWLVMTLIAVMIGFSLTLVSIDSASRDKLERQQNACIKLLEETKDTQLFSTCMDQIKKG